MRVKFLQDIIKEGRKRPSYRVGQEATVRDDVGFHYVRRGLAVALETRPNAKVQA